MMKPVAFLAFSRKAVKLYESCCRRACKENGINQTAFDVIMFLENNPDYNTAVDICEIRGIKMANASQAIDRLVKDGFLRREADAGDRRKTRLFLTAKTEDIVREGHKIQEEFGKGISEGILPEEAAVYEQVTEKIITNIYGMYEQMRRNG